MSGKWKPVRACLSVFVRLKIINVPSLFVLWLESRGYLSARCSSTDLGSSCAMVGCSTDRIRIGPPWYKYHYNRKDDDVWVCTRGSDAAAHGEFLLLVREEEMWTAYDVKSVDARKAGVPVWRTHGNATSAGEHTWQKNKNRFLPSAECKQADWTDTDLTFVTVSCLEPASADEQVSLLRSRSRSSRR